MTAAEPQGPPGQTDKRSLADPQLDIGEKNDVRFPNGGGSTTDVGAGPARAPRPEKSPRTLKAFQRTPLRRFWDRGEKV